MKTTALITSLLMLFMIQGLNAQITFEKTYTINGDNVAYDVRQTADGGFIVCGTTDYSSLSSGDIFLLKTAANGDTLWTRIFGGIGAEIGNSVLETSDGGFIIAGYTNSFGAGGTDAYLVKTDSKGNLLWNKAIGTSGGDAAYGIIQTADGGYVFSGYENSSLLNGQSHLVKTDAAGNVIWSKTYGTSNRTNFSFALVETDEGGYMLGGYENQFLSNNYEYSLIKTDGSGNLIWYKTYGDADLDRNFTLTRSLDGGYVMAGTNFTVSSSEINLVKVDANGNLVWTKNYGGIYNEFAYALSTAADGGFVFGGFSFSFSSNNSVYYAKTDADGNLLWSHILQGTGYDILYAIRETAEGGYILAGVKNEVAGTSGDLYLSRTDANGQTGCSMAVNSTTFTPALLVGSVSSSGTSVPLVTAGTPVVTAGASVTTLCSSCSVTATITPSGNVELCSGQPLTLEANSGSGLTYQWYRNGNALSGATSQTHNTKKAGDYFVVVSVSPVCSDISETTAVTVIPSPPATITPIGSLDLCDTGFVVLQANTGLGLSYQWLRGTVLITGATDVVYIATKKGNYKVQVTASNGCSKLSKVVKVVKTCREGDLLTSNIDADLSFYPNPSSGQFTIRINLSTMAAVPAMIVVTNWLNQEVYREDLMISGGQLNQRLTLPAGIPDGPYLVRVFAGEQVFTGQISLMK